MACTAVYKASSCPRPLRHRLAIAGRYQEVAKPPSLVVDRNIAPGAGPENDGSYVALSIFRSGECALHLLLSAVVGVDEVWAHQANHEAGGVEFGLDGPVEVFARLEHPVVPDANQAFTLECGQLYEEAVLQLFIAVRV